MAQPKPQSVADGRENLAHRCREQLLPKTSGCDAVGQITPVLQDVAAETTQAINTFQADKGRLFASDYATETKQISDNADKVAQHLHDDLKLANAEATEGRVSTAIDKQNTASPIMKPGI